jgi:hypothetical protein
VLVVIHATPVPCTFEHVVEDYEADGFDFKYGLCIPDDVSASEIYLPIAEEIANLKPGEHVTLDAERVDMTPSPFSTTANVAAMNA